MPHMDGEQLAKNIRAVNMTVNHSIILVSAEDYVNNEQLFSEV